MARRKPKGTTKQMRMIRKAAEAAGSQSELARKLRLANPSPVWQWCSGYRPIPPAKCIQIEKIVNGAVTRYDLRPDVFGPAPEAA